MKIVDKSVDGKVFLENIKFGSVFKCDINDSLYLMIDSNDCLRNVPLHNVPVVDIYTGKVFYFNLKLLVTPVDADCVVH